MSLFPQLYFKFYQHFQFFWWRPKMFPRSYRTFPNCGGGPLFENSPVFLVPYLQYSLENLLSFISNVQPPHLFAYTTTQLMRQLLCALICRAQKKEIGWKAIAHIYGDDIPGLWNKMKRRMHLGSWFHTLAVGLLRRPRRNRRSVYSGNLFQPSLTFSPGMPCPASPSLQRHIHSEPGDRKAECKHI